jgi:hypothetical protein
VRDRTSVDCGGVRDNAVYNQVARAANLNPEIKTVNSAALASQMSFLSDAVSRIARPKEIPQFLSQIPSGSRL